MRIEANTAFVIALSVSTAIVVLIALVLTYRIDQPLVYAAFFVLVVLGVGRLLFFVVPSRLFSRGWLAADERGIAARTVRGIVRYPWDRMISVHWLHLGRYPPFGKYTSVYLTPALTDPEAPYGPINPLQVNLWFLSKRERSLEIGREFLAVCGSYGVKTGLVVGKIREP